MKLQTVMLASALFFSAAPTYAQKAPAPADNKGVNETTSERSISVELIREGAKKSDFQQLKQTQLSPTVKRLARQPGSRCRQVCDQQYINQTISKFTITRHI